GPVDRVMPIGPPAGQIATLEDAPVVPGLELAPERRRDRPARVADLVFELCASGDPGDGGVAGKTPDGLGMDGATGLELAGGCARKTGHGVGTGPDDQVRPLTCDVGEPFTTQLSPGKLYQRIGLPLT